MIIYGNYNIKFISNINVIVVFIKIRSCVDNICIRICCNMVFKDN